MSEFLNKTYGGMVVKVKTLWFVAVQSQMDGAFDIHALGACKLPSVWAWMVELLCVHA